MRSLASWRGWGLLAGLLLAGAALGLSLRLVPIRSDPAALLPAGRDAASRLMVSELTRGEVARIVLGEIEGTGPVAPATLADLSRRLATALGRDKRLALVENGARLPAQEELDRLFAYRYLLAPSDPAQFDAAALRQDFQRLLRALQGSASALVEEYGLADPTGALPAILAAWRGQARIGQRDGVWMTQAQGGAARALLVLELADGADPAAALDAVQAGFERLRDEAPVRLRLAGPAVITRHTQEAIDRDARLVSIASLAAVAALLIWRFRSPLVLAALAIPVVLGVAAAMAATGLRYGFVHAITLGFGMTMLGVTADYPVLFIGHRKAGEAVSGTFARIGATFAAAALTAAIGLSGMAAADTPAVGQFGTFAVVGVVVAAAATRFLLPGLVVAAGLAPVGAGNPRLLRRLERWRSLRPWAIALAALAMAGLALDPPRLRQDLGSLAGIRADDLALDAGLRRELGVVEPGQVGVVVGATTEAVLQAEEALRPALDRLAASGGIGGAEMAADLLPSAARQRARRDALPDGATLAASVAAAATGLGFTPTAFQPFVDAVAASRSLAPLRLEQIRDPALRARLDALFGQRDAEALGFVSFRDVRDGARLAALFAGGNFFVDIGAATRALSRDATRSAARVLAISAGAALLFLLVFLRDRWRLLRIGAAVGSALLVTVALLSLAGMAWSLVQLAALQFVAGLGLDYALFFSRPQVDAEERSRTLHTLLVSAGMALLTFGLLALCRTPLLSGIGITVAVGVGAALGFAFLLSGPRSLA